MFNKKPSVKNASYTARVIRTALKSAGFPMSEGAWDTGYFVEKSENMVFVGHESRLYADSDRTEWRARTAEVKAFLEASGYVFEPGMNEIRCEA